MKPELEVLVWGSQVSQSISRYVHLGLGPGLGQGRLLQLLSWQTRAKVVYGAALQIGALGGKVGKVEEVPGEDLDPSCSSILSGAV